MPLTDEQQTVVNHVQSTEGLTMVSAVAGSGKTTLLVEIAKAVNPTNGLYLAYNRAIANEASFKFPNSVSCVTTHSLAYNAVKDAGFKLKVEANITYRILPNSIDYETRCSIINALEHFFVSEYVDFEEFADQHTLLSPSAISTAVTTMNSMAEGKCACSHGFYLKLYHILLHDGDIEYEPFDLIMLDEAGDINLVTLEIFKLLPSPRKVMVGDQHQNIYNFNRTVNCFSLMHDKGTMFPLSQSFRVSDNIASHIQRFCTKYLHEDMQFKGVPVDTSVIESSAFISRTNAALIVKMLELNELGIPYNLTRKPDTMFQMLKMLCMLKRGGYVSVPGYSYLQQDVEDYHKSPQHQLTYKSQLAYIRALHSDDPAISAALQLIFTYGAKRVMACYDTAKKHHLSRKKHSITLGTAHSTKGLTTH